VLTPTLRVAEQVPEFHEATETRFDAAYKAIMQAALVALMANGFRPDTKKPGHQSLPKTIGLENDRVVVLDTPRHKRNLSDYTGEDIDHASVGSAYASPCFLLASRGRHSAKRTGRRIRRPCGRTVEYTQIG
jgi:hypothetical protein